MSVTHEKIWIFDTTLRDGEQALKASLSQQDKLRLAHRIAQLNVDVMEVGFPISSPGDFESVYAIAEQIKGPTICALGRALPKDIQACGEALKPAEKGRIHTFIATSPIHLQHKLRMDLAGATDMAVKAIQQAKQYTDDVEFSCEDAGRTPIDDLCRIVEQAIHAGATTINLPDTVGYTVPAELAHMVREVKNRVPNIDKAIISVHCHNDLGLAVANSIEAVAAGARQIECTINGIGERAGNCSLEEVAMILDTRSDQFNVYSNIRSNEIYRTSQLASQLCHMPIQPNKAIVGTNAFSHSSGIHQDGVLKAQNTYEIISPEKIGLAQNELNMTSRSGRHVIQHRLAELGYKPDDYQIDTLYERFLALADKKGQVYDYELEALLYSDQRTEPDYYQLDLLSVTCTSANNKDGKEKQLATATVSLRVGDDVVTRAALGNGPVDAAYKAIGEITGEPLDILDYNIGTKGHGADALAQADVLVSHEERKFHGVGLETDIVRASVLAYVQALNVIREANTISEKRQKINGI